MKRVAPRDVELAARLAALPDDALLSPNEASALTGFANITLRKWRAERRGPPHISLEGMPRYRMGDLKAYMRGAANQSGAERAA